MKVHEARERLCKIAWRQDDARTRSNVALVQEYLRRVALWAAALRTDEWPFFDVALALRSDVRAPREAVESVRARLTDLSTLSRHQIANVCEWYLHWIALSVEDPSAISPHDLPEPYEPLIVMFERQGLFNVHESYINVGLAGIPIVDRATYESSTPRIELSREALDSRD